MGPVGVIRDWPRILMLITDNMAPMTGMDNSSGAAFAERVRHADSLHFPSPTGEMHLGNARTALFNFLLARHLSERFLLRIEDTDTVRSREEHTTALVEDLRWLGLEWDAGPDKEDGRGPYRQSQRAALYKRFLETLEREGRVYPCYCSPLELEVSRKAQLASGKPPRYAGTCRRLSAAQREQKKAQGIAPSMRFEVPLGRRIEFADFVHGPQSFVYRTISVTLSSVRADGNPRHSFSVMAAIDDATMGVTQVLRGEDLPPRIPLKAGCSAFSKRSA